MPAVTGHTPCLYREVSRIVMESKLYGQAFVLSQCIASMANSDRPVTSDILLNELNGKSFSIRSKIALNI